MKIRIAKISLASVLLASILGMVGTESAGATTVVRYAAYPYNLSGYVYPEVPQFTCRDYNGLPVSGVNSFYVYAPSGLGVVVPAITVETYFWNGVYLAGENSNSANAIGINEIDMHPGSGWRQTSSGSWYVTIPGHNISPGHGWYFVRIQVQWWSAPDGVGWSPQSKVLDVDYIEPTAATDYADSAPYTYSHYVIDGHQVCYM